MRTKKMSKKLTLNKITIADIKNEAMKKVYGVSDGICPEFCLEPGGTGGGGVTEVCSNTCNTCEHWCYQTDEVPVCV